MEDAVVVEALLQRDVAQRRRLEHPAVLRLAGQIVPQRSTQAQVVVCRIPVRWNCLVSWQTQRDETEIGE